MSVRPEVAGSIVDRLAAICLGLPEAEQEPAWTGTRWRIRRQVFAHVLMLAGGWPPAYARAAGSDGPATLLTFRMPVARLSAARFSRPPFFRPVWFRDIAGMRLDARSDWDEVAGLLAGSYRLLAPKKLAALVDRVDD